MGVQDEKVRLFQQLQTDISRLYERFAEKFPDERDFWRELSRDEELHAKWADKLLEAARQGKLHVEEGRTKTYTLKTVMKHVEAVESKVNTPSFTLKNALLFALDLEHSRIEKNVFGQFHAVDEGEKGFLFNVSQKTQEHTRKVERKWDEFRGLTFGRA
jgi:hypothetical protein